MEDVAARLNRMDLSPSSTCGVGHPSLDDAYSSDAYGLPAAGNKFDGTVTTKQKRRSADTVGPLSYETKLEADSVDCNSITTMWGMLRLHTILSAAFYHSFPEISAEFIVMVDTSASMAMECKLATVCATIEYMLERLVDRNVLFSLVQFSDTAQELVHRIRPTTQNITAIRATLKELKANGSTNLGDALDKAMSILSDRTPAESDRLTYVYLLTDGLINTGSSPETIVETLRGLKIKPSIAFQCIGFGPDHCSRMLQAIAFCTCGGLYFYVDEISAVSRILGECLGAVFSTVADDIVARIDAQDGCRLVQFATKFPISKLKQAKQFEVNLGSMYGDEDRTVLFRVSLRNMKIPMETHPLLNIRVTYRSTRDSCYHSFEQRLSVMRPKRGTIRSVPRSLSVQLNRFRTAEAIDRAICRAWRGQYEEAVEELKSTIKVIEQSPSRSEAYCSDLMKDLRECYGMICSENAFATGVHEAHALSTMYFQERSTGRACRASNRMDDEDRSSSYGYVTQYQHEEGEEAIRSSNRLISGYVQMED